jgi:hypothetical protein
MPCQALHQLRNEVGDKQIVQLLVQRPERRKQPRAENRIRHHGIPDERQRRACLIEAVQHNGRLQIKYPVTQTVFSAGAAIVQFVGMEHDNLAGQAVMRRAAIPESLDAMQRHADGVGIVTMEIEGAAVEPGLDTLHSDAIGRRDDAVLSRVNAQTSKTLKGLAI